MIFFWCFGPWRALGPEVGSRDLPMRGDVGRPHRPSQQDADPSPQGMALPGPLPASAALTRFSGLACRPPTPARHVLPWLQGCFPPRCGVSVQISLLRGGVPLAAGSLERGTTTVPVAVHLLAVGTWVTDVPQVSRISLCTWGACRSAFVWLRGSYRRSPGSLWSGYPGALGGSAALQGPGGPGHLVALQALPLQDTL